MADYSRQTRRDRAVRAAFVHQECIRAVRFGSFWSVSVRNQASRKPLLYRTIRVATRKGQDRRRDFESRWGYQQNPYTTRVFATLDRS